MRVLHRDAKTGEVRLKIQNADDLWHLCNLVEAGDLVRAFTYRREEAATDKVRPERGEKVRIKLGIRVERVEYQDFSDRLRISGVIAEGPQDLGRHHTLIVGVDDDLTIVKEWRDHHLRRIEEAVEATERPLVTVLSIDDEEALIAVIHQMGIREVATIHSEHHGKMFPGPDTRAAYFQEILSKVSAMDIGMALLVVGPGFEREDFARFVGAKILEETRVAQETRLVERLLEEVAKGGLFAYGPDEVRTAVDAGAVETLLVSDEKVKDLSVEDLMRRVESARGRVVVVSSRHEAGKKLVGLGGLGGILRFPIR
ncbi:MAG: mRNA surveillance protein pelota [Methanobacteriota archaeon]|nr:MAG: mRNA surveillance protein pelota [Euryarchaeota archaeon]